MHRLSRICSVVVLSSCMLLLAVVPCALADAPSSAAEAVVSTQAQGQVDKSLEAQADAGEASDLAPQSDAGRNMYRLYNPHSGEHFYTANINEARNVFFAGWAWEGIGWVAPTSGQDVYRLYNPNAGDHHYTMSAHERDVLIGKGWTYEGVGWKSGGDVGVLRQYNPNAATGTHNFTTSSNEDSTLAGYGWRREGTAWKCLSAKGRRIDGFWALSKLTGGLERYWIASDGNVARDRYVQPSEGAGYVAFACSDGTIVRGAWDNGRAQVFLADNDGRLTGANGWLVTGDYDGGRMRRYYVDGKTHTARTGHFTVGGAHYWGCGGVGYVLCGKMRMGDGMLIADADGRLCLHHGWLVTGDYDGGALRRYYFDGCVGYGLTGARVGFFGVDGWDYYASLDEGYLVSGGLRWGSTPTYAGLEGRPLTLSNLNRMLSGVPGGVIESFGPSWSLSGDRYEFISSALHAFWDDGQDASFVVLDLATGAGLASDAYRANYGASCLKGAYVTYICCDELAAGTTSLDEIGWQMDETAVWSNNDTYGWLWDRFGTGRFSAFLSCRGVSGYGEVRYPWTCAFDMARIWGANATFLLSDAPYADYARSILDHGFFSTINYELGGSTSVYSKPGWYPPGAMTAYNDCGIVWRDGHPFVVAVLTTANCDSDEWKLRGLVRALYDTMPEMESASGF